MKGLLLIASIIVSVFFLSNQAKAQGSQTVAGGSQTAPITFPGGGCTYNWINNTPGIGLPANGTGDIAAFKAINMGSTPIIATIMGTPIATGCGGPITYTITVNPSAFITASIPTGTISACVGSASVSPHIQRFTVFGTGLTNNITATAPTGFEVSLSAGSAFGKTVTILQNGGAVNNIVVYVRSAASATGNIGGTVTLTSQGVLSQDVNVSGTVNALPTVNTVGNQTVSTGNKTTAINFTGTGNTFNWVNNTPGIGLPASGAGNIPSFAAVNNGSGPVTATITVTPVNVDYAYIANENSNTDLSVINTSTNTVVSNITVGANPTGVAVSPDGGKAYVTNNSSGTVSVINTSTNSVITTIQVGQGPTGICISPDGSRVYVANTQNNTLSIINTATNKIIATIPVDTPYGVVAGSNGQWIYVTDRGSHLVTVIDPVNNSIATTIQVGLMPGQVITARAANSVFVANSNSNTVTLIDGGVNAAVMSIPVGTFPTCLAVNPEESLLYVSNAGSNNVSVISLLTVTVVATIPVGSYPLGLSFSDDGLLYVNNFNDGTVSVIDPGTNSVISTIPVGVGPVSMGNFIKGGSGCAGPPITFTITVNSTQPTITTGTASGNISACVGLASASPDIEQFTVSGNNLTNDIVAKAPAGFEVSLSANGGYGNSVTLIQSGGKVNGTVYVRSAASATGEISGNVVLSSPGAAALDVAVSAIINPLINVKPVSNQAVKNGSPTTAVSFSGTAKVFNWVNNTPSIGLPASGTGNIAAFNAVNNGTTATTATITVTPVPESFAYVPNGSSNNVSVISIAKNAVVATIPTGVTPFGVAISPDGRRVYISNQGTGTISIIDAATNKIVSTINEDPSAEPSGIVLSPDGTKLYVANYDLYSNQGVYIYDTATNALIDKLPIKNLPLVLAISHNGSRLYELGGGTELVAINTADNTIVGNIPVAAGITDLLVSSDDSKLYITNYLNNTVTVVDLTTNTVVTTITTGKMPVSMVLNPDNSRLYVANGYDGTITIINTSDYSVMNTIPAGEAPLSISISPDGRTLYAINSKPASTVTAINTTTNQIISAIPVGSGSNSIGNFILAGSGCADKPITFDITVNPSSVAPTITVGHPTGNISACEGSTSESPHIEQFTVSGNYLTNDIVATAPLGFEVSLSATGRYNISATMPQLAGVVKNITVYVRSAASATGNITGNVTLTSQGASTQNIPVTGQINPLPAVNPVPNQIVVSGSLTSAVHFTGTASNYNWVNDNGSIGVKPGDTPGSDIAPFIAINTSSTPLISTFFVTPVNLTTGCSGATMTFTIEVDPASPAVITTTGALSSLSTTYGSASASTGFSVSGVSMNSGIVVTPPPGFEVSTNNGNFSPTVTAGAPGTINTTTAYIRLGSKTPVGSYSGYVTLSSNGATSVNVPVPTSVVSPAPLTITANNVQKHAGQTLSNGFVLTGFSSGGLQNNESIGNVFMAYGDGAAASAKVGTYTGSVLLSNASGGSFDPKNYTITYKNGDIIVTEGALGGPIAIPNAFTPNGDGINDVWNISPLADYPSCLVSIFNRYGNMVYQSRGYGKPWDGNYNGNPLPTGTYYYIISLENGQQPLSGYVALIR